MNHPVFYRSDYRPPAYLIHTIHLEFDLDPQRTVVKSTMRLTRNQQSPASTPLELSGESLELIQVKLNGKIHHPEKIHDHGLILNNLPDEFELSIENACFPEKNTALTGLYLSKQQFFTQCEAEGFRYITYFLDRPDVMSLYTVKINADKHYYPVLLSNGNLIESGDLDENRHYAIWEDPFKKPSYLFALVAGHLSKKEQILQTKAGEKLLQIWVEKQDLDKIDYAMQSLIAAIQWDEKRFHLSLDLERFMIVAVSDFNMGAMENKGLNLFNSKYVLANAETATDQDFLGIESVIGHEYFHNWTGNRVTCRDWFQLSLKEGLTVFRDQEFSIDQAIESTKNESERGVHRIQNVIALRQHQFPEDAGPMAHPVRPESYIEIDNFYTSTIYEKGAEVIRMYQTLLGQEGFKKGLALYFERHDGQAVTCDDFRLAMADANKMDLTQFERWYSQAGTPIISAQTEYNVQQQTFTIHLHQSFPEHIIQASAPQPLLIPFAVGLLDQNGQDIPLQLVNENTPPQTTKTLIFKEKQQSFTFKNISTEPIASLLRDFSAPVIVQYPQSDQALAFLFQHDSDPFNRWESGQHYMTRILLQLINQIQLQQPSSIPHTFLNTFRKILTDQTITPAFKALLLSAPSDVYLMDAMQEADPLAITKAKHYFSQYIANHLHQEWLSCYQEYAQTAASVYTPSPNESGKRSLKNLALHYLVQQQHPEYGAQLAQQQYEHANNMTDRFQALSSLIKAANKLGESVAQTALSDFYQRFKNNDLVIDKWFAIQACRSSHPHFNAFENLKELMQHPDFNEKNPNRFRSLVFSFCMNNFSEFHQQNAQGYDFWAEQVIKTDQFNPQLAARLARILENWRHYAMPYRELIKDRLELIQKQACSRNLLEIIQKSLQNTQ